MRSWQRLVKEKREDSLKERGNVWTVLHEGYISVTRYLSDTYTPEEIGVQKSLTHEDRTLYCQICNNIRREEKQGLSGKRATFVRVRISLQSRRRGEREGLGHEWAAQCVAEIILTSNFWHLGSMSIKWNHVRFANSRWPQPVIQEFSNRFIKCKQGVHHLPVSFATELESI